MVTFKQALHILGPIRAKVVTHYRCGKKMTAYVEPKLWCYGYRIEDPPRSGKCREVKVQDIIDAAEKVLRER